MQTMENKEQINDKGVSLLNNNEPLRYVRYTIFQVQYTIKVCPCSTI